MRRILILALVFCCAFLSKANAQLVSVEVREVKLDELYAVEYPLYTKEPMGAVTIYNPTNSELRAAIILGGEQYINAPMKMSAKLPPKEETKVPLHVDLDVSVLNLSRQVEQVPITIDIGVYLNNLNVYPEKLEKDLIIHDIHKVPAGDPMKIAMFVDPSDKYIMAEISAGMGSTSEEKAKSAFELLQKKGIYCVGAGTAQIQYPRELLKVKFGSFYDTSFLYTAVLELLGVETELMFSSGVMLPLYRHQGNWHPVDMNMLSQNFDLARAAGAKLQNSMSSRGAETVVLREAWKKYAPLRFPELAPADMSQLRLVDKYIEEDRLDDAAEVFSKLLEKYPDQPVLLNNAANVDLLMGNMQQAVDKYARSADRSPDDGGLYLNMGIAYSKMGDEEKSIEYIGKAYTKLGSYLAMCQMLNLDAESAFYHEIDALLRKAVHETTEKFTLALGTRSLKKSQYPLYWKRFQK
jgi:tetratricopeptide (TPR) repeat protein